MPQTKVSLTEPLLDFVNHYAEYGFEDKSTLVRTALTNLRRELEQKRIEESAELYATLYAEDSELQALTDAALEGWPE
ncbi:MAG: hypothetical protein M9936_26170 [Caldilinea sp.]|nr:hypothetical protein [Caldilinea sp.]MCB0069547.1 hypothetical protein [Caldilineaceae bacterium]MCB0042241.1 hypothetical protein [Caldilinea sp.]MCB0148911.1 hypothetical protein [Caldilineaceae bacterium]MCB9113676.1 hypothetical protein [Caldilineaceae bacterium]